MRRDVRGMSLPEVMLVLAVIAGTMWLGLPALKAYSIEATLFGSAEIFKSEFRRARWLSIRSGRQTALRFETRPDGVYLGIYSDGDWDGVLSRDIQSGVDPMLSQPRRLTDSAEVRVGIQPGVEEPPPGRGLLDPDDPIRFGRSDMVSFSPLGTATPGTLYLTGHGLQVAVRVTGTDARIRTMVWHGAGWRDR